ncbi:unnamed protein product [uncultured bacterium]|nr:unnamed protein product [uncultured bacterium]
MSAIEPRTHSRLFVRLAGTTLAAMAFLFLCWIMAGSVYGDTRLLAGPVGFFRTQSVADKIGGAVPTGILLPCIFAVGVWRNTATIALSILAAFCWIAVGIWIEGIASV